MGARGPHRHAFLLAATVLGLFVASPGAAQDRDPVAAARALYAQAAYDEALAALGSSTGMEAHTYRALCLLALGKRQEAEASVEALIDLAPAHTVSDADYPPRFVQIVAETKQRLLPVLIRRLFANGRDHFHAKAFDRAKESFEQVLALAGDPALAGAADAADVRLLASGYMDMMAGPTTNAPAAGAATAPGIEAARLVTPDPPARPAGDVHDDPETASTPLPKPTPSEVRRNPVASAPVPTPMPLRPRVIVAPAVTIHQEVPSYTRSGGAPRELTGAIRVVIGIDGRVTSASIERSIDPRYDARLLEATRSWRYEPATRDGTPIPSDQVVVIRVGATR
jgi:protein TonB